jgi:Arylsulfatase A and related enzymes
MDEIPKGSEPFEGDIKRLLEDSSGVRMRLPGQASGKPNVLLVMLDDVGFGSCKTFGGFIQSPGVN